MSEKTIHEIEFAPGRFISLETGRLAKQADGAVVARMGDTMVLATAVLAREPKENQSFFPLTVEYREKFSSAGKIPGGFIKREGRSNDKEILTSRLIDRTMRPLFAEGFLNETQIIVYVLSADTENDADVLAGVAASAALMCAGAPFEGPTAHVRVGRIDGEFIINPTLEEYAESDFNLVVAGKEDAIVMVEGEMIEVTEEEMLEAFDLAHDVIKKICQAQHALVEMKGDVEPIEFTPNVLPEDLIGKVRELVGPKMTEHLAQPYQKETFYGGIADLKDGVLNAMLGEPDPETGEGRAEETEEGYSAGDIKNAVGKVESDLMREMILSEGRRIDGRGPEDVRHIWSEVGYLPRVHGSAIFTRGETQVLASVTLGTRKDAQAVDQVFDVSDRRFFLHYNFPPFCTGEAKFLRGASRREIGHGYLAERALMHAIPEDEEFPYTIRINADVLESNGSSSMASVCSGMLAMMDAGVPIKKSVAGVAMGLITDGSRTAVLTDILGTEDHLGDMDFKVTGTRDGITACQMDIKVTGLSREVLVQALEQARRGRLHILDKMDEVLDTPRAQLSPHAPRLTQITIDSDFIGAVIGPGGKIIQAIQKETNTVIEIEERDNQGFVTIAATNKDDAQAAVQMIKGIVTVPEEGEEYEGTVKGVQSFGAIIEIMPGREGLLHVSEIDHGYVENVEDYIQVGDKVKVKLIEVRDDGKLRLSRKVFLPKPENGQDDDREYRSRSRERDSGDRDNRSRGGGRGGRSRNSGGGGGGGNRRSGGGRSRR
ncbi:MAG: polyribonucleotide nucleotidyltransferase [Rhodothermaceae bacterium]|nr:polyribonucleotide nucleotidyltransferase [Rhodothermaceae bacterium]